MSRLAPTTATSVIAKRADVSNQPIAAPPAPSTVSDTPMGTMRAATQRARRLTRRASRTRDTRWRAMARPCSARSSTRPRPPRGEMTEL